MPKIERRYLCGKSEKELDTTSPVLPRSDELRDENPQSNKSELEPLENEPQAPCFLHPVVLPSYLD